MLRIVALVACAILGVPSADVGQRAPDAELARIYNEYRSLDAQPDTARLVQLDQELRRLIPHWNWEGVPPVSSGHYRPDYEAIGVSPGLFDWEVLVYSGKLLREAHRNDPTSHRSHTLYSTVFDAAGEDGEAGNALPSPVATAEYLREFPSGPFALHAHLAAGNFFADLFKVIRAEESGTRVDYKYDCFKRYITQAPLSSQGRTAQDQAVDHYAALTRLRPDIQIFAEWLADMKDGKSEGWHYCAD